MRRLSLVPGERIQQAILLVRGERVMLDSDLAKLYGVPTKVLLQAVRRNRARFPGDFMFQLTAEESADLRSHFVTSRSGHGGRRYASHVFTEHGVAMLSSVLRSGRAIQVNIAIVRAFVRLRQMLASHVALARKLEALEKRYDAQLKAVFDAIRELMGPPARPSRRIGFEPRRGESVSAPGRSRASRRRPAAM
jgi:hypothetical protein